MLCLNKKWFLFDTNILTVLLYVFFQGSKIMCGQNKKERETSRDSYTGLHYNT